MVILNSVVKSIKYIFSINGLKVILLTAFLYYFTARLGYFITFNHTVILPLWPPAGVGLAMMILYGRTLAWPGIAIASLLISLMATWNTPDLPLGIRLSVMIILTFSRVLEAITGYWLIKKYIGDNLFSNPQNTFRFLYITAGISFIGSGVLLLCLYIFNIAPIDNLKILLFDFWFGNVVGILLFTPLVLVVAKSRINFPERDNIRDFMFFVIMVIATFLLLQVELLTYPLLQALPFIAVPYLLWLAFRYDLLVGFIGVFIASSLALYFTVIAETGPFIILQSGEHSMLYLQVFIAVISFSTILLSASMQERNAALHELKELNENLEQKIGERTKELIKRNAELDSFVYSVSHDLRAPIASILGLINLAKKDRTEEREKYLDLMNVSALKQDQFIREILAHSRNSRIEVQRDEMYFAPFINELFYDLQFTEGIIEKGIMINQHKPFYTDKWRLTVILSNIISNSIRYRQGNSVKISITGEVTDRETKLVLEDNGKGIDKKHLPYVFNMFYRANEDSNGSGLGLYIVKEAIDKLNGTVSIDSTLEIGTKVTIVIPGLE